MSDIEPYGHISTGHGQSKLVELNNAHLDVLAADFRGKATAVYDAMGTDFIQKTDEGTELYLPVKDEEGKTLKFKTEVVHQVLRDLSRYRDDLEPQDKVRYSADIMYAFKKMITQFPDRIPHYFASYTINRALTNYKYTVGGETYDTYYPDGAIERWQSEFEPLIFFAKQCAQEGKALPKEWNALQEMYEASRKKSV